MAVSTPPPDLDRLRFLLAQVDDQMAHQRDEWDGLDRKATTVLATTGVLLGLVVNNAGALGRTPSPGPSVFFLALAALVVALGAGVVALAPRRLTDAPDPEPFLSGYADKELGDTIGTLVSTKAGEYRKNGDTIHSKLLAVRVQMTLVLAAGILLAVLLVIQEVA